MYRQLRMVRLVPKVSVKEFLALWLSAVLTRRLQRDKHRIDLAQNLGIVVFEHPPFLGLVVGVEDSETSGRLSRPFFLTPHPVVVAGILDAVIVQVVGVDDQRLAFREEDSAEARSRLTLCIGVKYVRAVEVPCRH